VLDQAGWGGERGRAFATSILLARSRVAGKKWESITWPQRDSIFAPRRSGAALFSAPYMIYCSSRQSRGREAGPNMRAVPLIHQCVVALGDRGDFEHRAGNGLFAKRAWGNRVLAARHRSAPHSGARICPAKCPSRNLDLARATALDVSAAVLQTGGAGHSWRRPARLTILATLATLAIASGSGNHRLARDEQAGEWPTRLAAAVRELAAQLDVRPLGLGEPASGLHDAVCSCRGWWALTHGEGPERDLLGAACTLVGPLEHPFLQGLCNFLSPRAAPSIRSRLFGRVAVGADEDGALVFGDPWVCLAVPGIPVRARQIAVLGLWAAIRRAREINHRRALAERAGQQAPAWWPATACGRWERPSANLVADLCSLGVVLVAGDRLGAVVRSARAQHSPRWAGTTSDASRASLDLAARDARACRAKETAHERPCSATDQGSTRLAGGSPALDPSHPTRAGR